MTQTLDPRLTPARPHAADVALRGVVAAERYVAGEPARVVVPSAPLRRAPSPESGTDTEALLGDAVTAYDAVGDHVLVQLARDGYVGYLPADSLGPAGPEPTHRVAALRTFLYPAPDLKRPPCAHLSLGARLVVTGAAGAYLETPGGYVFARHCVPVGEAAPDYAGTAERMVGTPYLWGGRTTLGLDCSGLVQLCLDAAGLPCPRDADMQERALGRPLPPVHDALQSDGLQRGDFVFWKGHVGMMLDAARLIHANGHHMSVAVEPLAEAAARILATSYGPVTGIRRL
ncbi:NlpC/P60 family protein [Methylobacterium sp. NEAU 140]|uniref:C40 family peptidase n=1 Tax=Methylobacterium sp. NEAU 140 TaxID=3064945 RepID=UPI002736DD14|nr:NlpC/P60 family protein [Methylobacterium sp. NEAU 140]MDP4022683.1 NlpC/P60 family protein [Methylobacterium sp. NEAU 140]